MNVRMALTPPPSAGVHMSLTPLPLLVDFINGWPPTVISGMRYFTTIAHPSGYVSARNALRSARGVCSTNIFYSSQNQPSNSESSQSVLSKAISPHTGWWSLLILGKVRFSIRPSLHIVAAHPLEHFSPGNARWVCLKITMNNGLNRSNRTRPSPHSLKECPVPF